MINKYNFHLLLNPSDSHKNLNLKSDMQIKLLKSEISNGFSFYGIN